MLILYVHAHMHVGTRVWLAPTCEWVWYTLGGKGREEEKSEERRTRSENGRSLFQRTLRSSTARSPSKQDTQWQRWQRWQWWQWWVWRTWSPLSLSLLLLSSPLVVVDTMVKSRGRSRRFLLSFPVAVRCVWSRSSKIILDRSLLSKTGGSSFARFEGRLYLAEIFFFRERDMIDPGIFRQRVERSFGTSIEAVSVGGAGISRYADDGWIWAWKKWSEDVEWHFFLRRFAFCGKSSLKIRGGDWSLRSLFFYSLFFFFCFF